MRAPLNKTFLAEEQRRLRIYEEYLPSLDLKRKQLLAALNRERSETARLVSERDAVVSHIGERLPMLAGEQLDLDGLVEVTDVVLGEQNLLGIRLPVLEQADLARRPYGWLTLPHWVDLAAASIETVLKLDLEIQVARERVGRLDDAARTLTQRVNLFEKVLIPEAIGNIRNIRIYMADSARYAAIRAKIAKSKSAASHQAVGRAP